MNKNTQCYYDSALKMFLPVSLDNDIDGFVLTLGKKRYFFYGHGTPLNNATSVQISRNKYFTNKVLEKAGVPVPKAIYIHESEFERLEEKIANLSFPLVAKPMDEGKFGRDVLCNIQTIEELQSYLITNFPKKSYIIIEEFHGNLNSYRVLVFNNRVIGVVIRHPAHVLGDGKHTIEELVELANSLRPTISDTLAPIVIDEECLIRLKELGIDVNYIPKKDEQVTLCYTSNASRGGTYASLGKKICKENKRLLIYAAKALNLRLVGFDVQCLDIMKPIELNNGVIIESNDSPSVRIHEHAIIGAPLLVTKNMIRSFIFRHPLSYLYGLYCRGRTGFFIRSIILIALFGIGVNFL